jgi:hypothetical protein
VGVRNYHKFWHVASGLEPRVVILDSSRPTITTCFSSTPYNSTKSSRNCLQNSQIKQDNAQNLSEVRSADLLASYVLTQSPNNCRYSVLYTSHLRRASIAGKLPRKQLFQAHGVSEFTGYQILKSNSTRYSDRVYQRG